MNDGKIASSASSPLKTIFFVRLFLQSTFSVFSLLSRLDTCALCSKEQYPLVNRHFVYFIPSLEQTLGFVSCSFTFCLLQLHIHLYFCNKKKKKNQNLFLKLLACPFLFFTLLLLFYLTEFLVSKRFPVQRQLRGENRCFQFARE